MEIELSNLICPKCLKGGYVNYIGQSYKYIAKCYNCGFYFETGTFLKEVSEKETNNVTTNADRIRNMEDDELAIWLCENIKVCSECIAKEFCKPTGEQANGMLAWLKQEDDE